MKKVMFVCDKNSHLSQMAEGFANSMGAGKIDVVSSGLEPIKIDPMAIAVMAEVGIDISQQSFKALSIFEPKDYDSVISLGEVNLPEAWVLPQISEVWHLDNLEGEEIEKFRTVRDQIKQRVAALIQPQSSIQIDPALVAEAISSFALVFALTGAIMVNQISGGAVTHIGICLVVGAMVAVLIYATGHISGAHFNPAVTLALWTQGSFPAQKVIPYILAQSVGAIAASYTLFYAFGNVANMGVTLPLGDNWLQSLILETILTLFLMLVILLTAVDRRSERGFAGIAIGLTVCLEAMSMGPISGASMNPVRSLAPALVTGIWEYQWLYWLAPILGAQLAVYFYKLLSDKQSYKVGRHM